jgi:hypothetical protein
MNKMPMPFLAIVFCSIVIVLVPAGGILNDDNDCMFADLRRAKHEHILKEEKQRHGS